MITLIFRNATPDFVARGPVAHFRIDGDRVCDEKGGLLARHAGHSWEVEGRSFLRMDCDDAATVQFERAPLASELYGPFAQLSSTDGICYAEHEVFAHFDEPTHSWFCHRDRQYWAAMVVTAVTA